MDGETKANLFLIAFLLVAPFGLILMSANANADPQPFGMNETTSYGILDNYVYLEFRDLVSKEQYVTNITLTYVDSEKTRTIEINDFLVYRGYNEDVYGYVNVSQGKYKTANQTCEIFNTTEICTDNYYDGLDQKMICNYVLADKTCLREDYVVTGQETRYDYLPTPQTKEKVVLNGIKIEQKVEGSVPLPKDGTVKIKIPMSHLLFYNITVPYSENKYNITACSQYGCVVLDPTWWNTSWLNRTSITFYQNSDNNARTFEPVYVNATSLTFSSLNEVRVVADNDMEITRDIIKNGTTWAYMLMLVNRSASSNATYYVYHNNPGVSAPSYSSQVTANSTHWSNSYISWMFNKGSAQYYKRTDGENANLGYIPASTDYTVIGYRTATNACFQGGSGGTGSWTLNKTGNLYATYYGTGSCAGTKGEMTVYANNYWFDVHMWGSAGTGYSAQEYINTTKFNARNFENSTGVFNHTVAGTHYEVDLLGWSSFYHSTNAGLIDTVLYAWNISTGDADLAKGNIYVSNTHVIGQSGASASLIDGSANISQRIYALKGTNASNVVPESQLHFAMYSNPLNYVVGATEGQGGGGNTAPSWSANTTSAPANYDDSTEVWVNVTWSDDGDNPAFNMTFLETNYTGILENETPSTDGNITYFNELLGAGTYSFRFYANDSEGLDNVTDTWIVTIEKGSATLNLYLNGEEGDKSYNYLQYVNATCTKNIDKDGLILYKNGTSVGTLSGNSITHNTQLAVGTWNYTCVLDEENYTASPVQRTATVSISTPGTIDAWYGYETMNISSQSVLSSLSGYDFGIIEHHENFSSIYGSDNSKNWSAMLGAISNSKDLNMRSSVSYYYDGDYSDADYIRNATSNISLYFADLKNAPYQEGVAMIVIEVNTSNTDADTVDFVNNISEAIVSATYNNFPLYLKGYGHSSIPTTYISNFSIPEMTPQTQADFVQGETERLRTNTTLSRFYYNLTTSIMAEAKNYHNRIITKLRGTPVGDAGQDSDVAEIDGGVDDIVVFNNQSSTSEINVVITGRNGKDVWDATNNTLIEKDTDGTFSVAIDGMNASIIFFDDIDHIEFNTTYSSLFKASTSSSDTRDYISSDSSGILDSWSISGANDAKIELWDPTYINTNLFIHHYEWVNASDVADYSDYMYIVISDKNSDSINNTIGTGNLGKTYGYISVADYSDSDAWVTGKKAEADEWIDTYKVQIFIDGLDTGIAGSNFEARFKNLTDYIRIDRGTKAILNDYTSYQNVSSYGDLDMKESFCGRWGGDVNNPTYTYEDFEIDYKRAKWAETLNKPQLAVAFGNIDNMTKMAYCYAEWLVLYGLRNNNSFRYAQPNFQAQREIYALDPGNILDQSWTNTSNTDYYRAYSNGIVHVNPVTHTWWFDDGREINSLSVCLELYNSMSTPSAYLGTNFTINNNTNNIYTITYDMVAGGTSYTWSNVCFNLTESQVINDFTKTGRYVIRIFPFDRSASGGQASLRNEDTTNANNSNKTGDNSWHDNGEAGGYPTIEPTWVQYGLNKNWRIQLKINSTIKTSIDNLYTEITRNEIASGSETNITLSSDKSYNITVWDNGTYIDFGVLNRLDALVNGSWEEMPPLNTTTCDSNNPSWNSTTTTDGNVWKSCFEQVNSTRIYVRFAVPSLSTQTAKATGGTVPGFGNQSASTPSSYNPSIASIFNISVTEIEAGSVVYLEENCSITSKANHTMTNTTYGGNTYNFSMILPACSNAYWKVYANNSLGWNVSDESILTIGTGATSINITVNGTTNSNVSYGIYENVNLTLTSQVNVTGLTINMTMDMGGFGQLNNTTSIYNVTTFEPNQTQVYNLTAWSSGNANYSASSRTVYITTVSVGLGGGDSPSGGTTIYTGEDNETNQTSTGEDNETNQTSNADLSQNETPPLIVYYPTRLAQVTGLLMQGKLSEAMYAVLQSMGDYFYRWKNAQSPMHGFAEAVLFRHITVVVGLSISFNILISRFRLVRGRHWAVRYLVRLIIMPMMAIFISLLIPSV